MSALRASLRMARRDALRSKGRSTLVFCMIGLPILAIVTMAVLLRTSQWSPAEALPYELGRADARLYGESHRPGLQNPDRSIRMPDASARGDVADDRHWTPDEARRALTAKYGPGVRITQVETAQAPVRTARGEVRADVLAADLRDPLTKGLLRVVGGRTPVTRAEVAISPALRDRGFRVGGDIGIGAEGQTKRIVGLVRDPRAPDRLLAQSLPGALGEGDVVSWLVATGRPVTWPDVREFNRMGATVLSREVVENMPSDVPAEVAEPADPATAAASAMAIAMVVLEVVLLAGPAFAVGIRRQRRRLALVAANGGDARRLRAIVLSQGAVIGTAAALFAAVAGVGLAAVVAAVVRARTDTVFGPFEVPWPWVLSTMSLGAASGLLAAYLPARQAARMNVVAALGGRRDDARPARGKPVLGLLLVIGGVVLSLAGARPLREFGPACGAVLVILGGVLITPWAVALAGRAASPLPLPLRFAVRDAARNPGRTAPAVAAILAAVAALTALAVGGSSDFSQRRVEYVEQLPKGSAVIDVPEAGDRRRQTEIRGAIAQELPGVPIITVRAVREMAAECGTAPEGCLRLELPGETTAQQQVTHRLEHVVGGAEQARLLLGRDDRDVAAALAAGRLVVFQPRPLAAGSLTLTVLRETGSGPKTVRRITVPAVAFPGPATTRTMIPSGVAGRLGLPMTSVFGVEAAAHRITPDEAERVNERLRRFDAGSSVYVERGFTESFGLPLLLLGATAALLALGGALIATGLSAADSRPDLATLAAVGARPRTRRLIMMGQAGCVAGLGCWLGIVGGLVPGVAAAIPLTVPATPEPVVSGVRAHGVVIDVPWLLLGAIAVAVPVAAMLTAGLCTRSRLPLVRRAAA